MEIGEHRQSLEFYTVHKISDEHDDRVEIRELVKKCRAKLIRTSLKDYLNRDFNSTSNKTERTFQIRYKYKNYISTDQQVLFNNEWYNVVDIEPDEQVRDVCNIRLRLL